MEVNKIIKQSVTMLQLKELEDILRSTTTIEEVENDDMELLINCINLVCNSIATDYIPLTKTKRVINVSGIIPLQGFAKEQLYKILRITDSYGQKLHFKIIAGGIVCAKGDVDITYSYFPREYTFNDTIDEFCVDLTERVVSMGVVSEYLFIRGNGDDASIWEDRFKNAMRSIMRPRREVAMPKRRWWQ